MKMISHVRNKTVNDLFINISHFLDHFVMLIFAKAAYDAGQHFGVSYEQIISYGTLGLVLFGACAPISARLADRYSRSLMMVVYHFVKNRREPNQQSVSIIILGLLGGAAMMALFAILAWRSRPARSHDGQAVGVTGDRLSARPHWHGLSKRTRGRFSTQYAFHIAANECDHPLLSFLRKRADVWRQDDVVHLFQ